MKNDSTLHLIGLLFLLATGSFVWFYPAPLCGDMPMHVAVAKALVDLLAHTGAANYPYTLNIVFSSYALPEIILAFLVKLFGVIYASKIALTAYAIGFPLSIWFLVSQIEPEARWAKLIGFPLTLNYFFHWGFWSYMVGEITVICAIAMSIRHTSTNRSLLIGAPIRVVTFLMHPAPVIALGIYDTVTVLLDLEHNPKWLNPISWQWRRMSMLWVPTLLCIAAMSFSLGNSTGPSFAVSWGSAKAQLIQLVRPFYITSQWWESAVPILMGLALISVACYQIVQSRKRVGILLAALFMVLVGLFLPRDQFFGNSWEIGARIVFIGLILLFSLTALFKKGLAKAVLSWVIISLTLNLGVSHTLWCVHSRSSERALRVLRESFTGAKISTEVHPTKDGPSSNVGRHVATWAWCLGYVADAPNAVAVGDFGPVKYVGLDTATVREVRIPQGLIVYHPYMLDSLPRPGYRQVLLRGDDIYTIYKK